MSATDSVHSYTGLYALLIRTSDAIASDIPAAVVLSADSGPCSFRFSMLPGQARELAKILDKHAAALDGRARDDGFSDGDMASASAQGFRDGQKAARVEFLTSLREIDPAAAHAFMVTFGDAEGGAA